MGRKNAEQYFKNNCADEKLAAYFLITGEITNNAYNRYK